MKKIKVNIKDTPILILFFGMVSTIGGGIWLGILKYLTEKNSLMGVAPYYEAVLEEITFCAVLHIILGVVLLLNDRKVLK